MRAIGSIITGLALAVAVLGCGSEEEPQPTGPSMAAPHKAPPADHVSGNQPPVIDRVTLQPGEPLPGERISANVEVSDAEGDRIELTYQWRVDGRRVEGDATLHPGNVKKGSVVEVRVVARDGQDESQAMEARATVGNQAPVLLGVVMEPLGDVTTANDVMASPRATDADGDVLEYSYSWLVNGEPADSEGAILPSTSFRRGDQIQLTVVASDGMDESEPLRSQPFEVGNAPPSITSVPGDFDESGAFYYQVTVEDPDGDSLLRYRLLEAPEGMKIDLLKGLVTWIPREDQAGKYPVRVQVDDNSGGLVDQSFEIQVAFEDEQQPPASPGATP